VTVGNTKVGVAEIVDESGIVGVNVRVGVRVSVDVNVGFNVFVQAATVAVRAVAVKVACCSGEEAQAETNKNISKAIRYVFI